MKFHEDWIKIWTKECTEYLLTIHAATKDRWWFISQYGQMVIHAAWGSEVNVTQRTNGDMCHMTDRWWCMSYDRQSAMNVPKRTYGDTFRMTDRWWCMSHDKQSAMNVPKRTYGDTCSMTDKWWCMSHDRQSVMNVPKRTYSDTCSMTDKMVMHVP